MKELDYDKADSSVLENYKKFIETILFILETSGNENPKRANIFTTNYDLLIEYTFEKILSERSNCYFNDGSRGFINRILSPQSYNLEVSEMGYYNNFKREVITINLQKMHGSVSWSKKEDKINVSYENKFDNILGSINKKVLRLSTRSNNGDKIRLRSKTFWNKETKIRPFRTPMNTEFSKKI